MNIEFAGFDWDDGNLAKCERHGVSRDEIEGVFSGPVTLLVPDEKHSGTETRFIAIGRVRGGRYIFVAFTNREGAEGVLIRPISARYMHRKEVAKYEQEGAALPHR